MPYALPCPCGSKISVQRSQAGSQVVCPDCQRSLEIPTIRGLSEFEIEATVNDADSRNRSNRAHWTLLRGMIAASCFVIALIGLGRASLYGVYRYSHQTPFTVEEMLQEAEQSSQQLSPVEVWDNWRFIQESGLGKKTPPQAFLVKRILEQKDSQMLRWAGAGAIGLLGMFASVYWPRR